MSGKEWEGEGIDPRFTLANERTFLAWTRTGIALIAAGMAVSELLPQIAENEIRRMLGIPLIAVGALLALAADRHRINVQASLVAGKGVPRSALPHLLTATITIFGIASILVVLF